MQLRYEKKLTVRDVSIAPGKDQTLSSLAQNSQALEIQTNHSHTSLCLEFQLPALFGAVGVFRSQR